ncbi:DUF2634 domain-containing protein, partial [Clostridium neonatale]
MIPGSTLDTTRIEFTEVPSKTFKLNANTNRINGTIDELEAVKQAIYLRLNTEKYDYIIYSWNYGVETKDLFGEDITYVYPELQRRITEALTQDDRINSVDAFSYEKVKNKV